MTWVIWHSLADADPPDYDEDWPEGAPPERLMSAAYRCKLCGCPVAASEDICGECGCEDDCAP